MNNNQTVTASSQVESTIPNYVVENYSNFVNFMQKSAESEERIGFGQDILQNLQKYRDFDTYGDKIVQYGTLNSNITETDDELVLSDTFGFPDNNGVLLIDDEVILYRTKNGNTLEGLQRGAAATTVLPTLRSSSTYVTTEAASHAKGAQVQNLSVMFLVAMLDNIHNSFTPNIDSSRVSPEVNRSSLLQNIRDFFSSKGSALGIKALFKMIFDQNEVSVTYPGDRMVKPSSSTWTDTLIMRTVPMPELLTEPDKSYVTPDKLLGTNIIIKDYRDDSIVGTVYSDYISTYPFESTVQYEFYLDEDSITGNIIANPNTTLTRQLDLFSTDDSGEDVTTVTVESTVGFPDSGIIFIESEGIEYTSKTFNQFLGCTRGRVSVTRQHKSGTDVYGPFYAYSEDIVDGVTKASYSFPIGLVRSVDIVDPGRLQLTTDSITPGDPGRTDPANIVANSFVENYTDELVTQTSRPPSQGYVSNYTYGVSGVYFDDEYTYVTSSNLPGYTIEHFTPFGDGSATTITIESDPTDAIATELAEQITTEEAGAPPVGPLLQGENAVHVIPNRKTIKENLEQITKGTDIVGVAVDGVPFYSNVSKEVLVHGKILRFKVINGGSNYINPSVFAGGITQGKVNLRDGSVESVDLIVSDEYITQPTVEISDGIGATISLEFDNYGRITSATVDDPGQAYSATPAIVVYDSSSRGKGASLVATTSAGSIEAIEIINSGIDYNPATTVAKVISPGSGAVVEAVCEQYRYDEYSKVRLNPEVDLDSSNAFLFPDANGENNKFAYLANPIYLRNSLGDDGTAHSPIIGWAMDGNPIYGPYGYANGQDDSAGIVEQSTGYYLPDDRTLIIPENSTEPAENPPSVADYPMGTFIQDYVFDPEEASILSGRILTDPNRDYLQAEDDDFIKYTANTISVVGASNGKVCNTPDFPIDRYPDGVFAYFATSFGDTGSFPYTVGPVFQNRPQSQNVILLNNGVEIETDKPESSYDDTEITVNFTAAKRLRNPYLTSTKEELEVQINSAAGTLPGSVSTVTVEDGSTARVAVDDFLYFDGSDTGGGRGASAFVTHVTTVDGVRVPTSPEEAQAGGFEIVTKVYSHRQRIDLSRITPTTSYTFPISFKINTASGSTAIVESYDSTNKVLEVLVTSNKLIKYGDQFRDARGRRIKLPKNDTANESTFDSDVVGATSTHISFADPTSEDSTPGDLFWSATTGRLYIYYNDGDTSQWVSAFPLGSRSIGDTSTYTSFGSIVTSTTSVSNPHTGNTIAISDRAPSRRTDGSANARGDLWWSTATGMLYIFNMDDPQEGGQTGRNEWSSEWVCTDPIGMVSMGGASDDTEYVTISAGAGPDYEDNVRVVISDTSPATLPGGDPITMGTLWWSPVNGKMFIYFTDSDSSQWVITNPSGTLSGQYSLDTLIVGDDSGTVDTLSILSEPTTTNNLWFESLDDIYVGDFLEISDGTPGSEEKETVEVIAILNENQIEVKRGARDYVTGNITTPISIPHGSSVKNTTRYIYRVVTNGKNGLRPGIEIIVKSPENTWLDGTYLVDTVGTVIVPEATAVISEGSITEVIVTSPGKNYTQDFYVYFSGGGGVGGYAYANVSPVDGSVSSVDVLEGGVNYVTVPAVVFDATQSEESFVIYTWGKGVPDPNLSFETTDKLIQNYTSTWATRAQLTSGGYGYYSLPLVSGAYHREADAAKTKIFKDTETFDTIASVEVISGGVRYTNPVAEFYDNVGSGSGATATVTVVDEQVTAVTVTNPGSGYIEPVLRLVEHGGVYSMTTQDIGRIIDVDVTNPGRNISTERSLAPELIMDIRLVFTRVNDYAHTFSIGDEIYQGSPSSKSATATIVEYDTNRQILKLDSVSGKFLENEMIYGPGSTGGLVTMSGQGDLKINVSSSAKKLGRFITDQSMVSETYPVIQDSYRYQWFSYDIGSPLQKAQYDTFVQEIIHPAGFARFSTVLLANNTDTPMTASEPVIVIS